MMFKGRRVGTLTTGITLVAFGLIFIARLVFPLLDYSMILSLWPLILIFLGIEIIASYFYNNQEKMKYDGWAIFLIIIMSLFAMGMSGAELIIKHLPEHMSFL